MTKNTFPDCFPREGGMHLLFKMESTHPNGSVLPKSENDQTGLQDEGIIRQFSRLVNEFSNKQ